MYKNLSFLLLITMLIPVVHAQKLSDITVYPSASENENRNIIWLDKLANEEDYKVEIIATKTGVKDCNHTSYHADLNRKSLKEWGYDFFVVVKSDLFITTLMGCSNIKNTLVDLPVSLTKSESLQPYNSRLPIVIYAPKEMQIKFKIWKVEAIESATVSND